VVGFRQRPGCKALSEGAGYSVRHHVAMVPEHSGLLARVGLWQLNLVFLAGVTRHDPAGRWFLSIRLRCHLVRCVGITPSSQASGSERVWCNPPSVLRGRPCVPGRL